MNVDTWMTDILMALPDPDLEADVRKWLELDIIPCWLSSLAASTAPVSWTRPRLWLLLRLKKGEIFQFYWKLSPYFIWKGSKVSTVIEALSKIYQNLINDPFEKITGIWKMKTRQLYYRHALSLGIISLPPCVSSVIRQKAFLHRFERISCEYKNGFSHMEMME